MAPLPTFIRARVRLAVASALVVAVVVAVVASAPSPAVAAAPTPVAAPSVSTARLRFVAFGDSLTSGYKTPGPSWPSLLASTRTDIQLVHNAGVVGDTTKGLLARIDRDVYAYSPDLLTIFVGLNDLSRCGRVTQVLANIETIVAGARAHGIPRIVLILNSHTIGFNSKSGHSCGPMLQVRIDQLDDALLAYGDAAGIQTIDLRPVMDTHGHYTKAYLVSDGVHFNNRGVAVVSQAISDQLTAGFRRHLRGPR